MTSERVQTLDFKLTGVLGLPQLFLSKEEMRMMIANASEPHNSGRVTFSTFLSITEMTQWY